MRAYPEKVTIEEGLDTLFNYAQVVGTEAVAIGEADGRVLATDIISKENIPPFKRSPYDGYALRAQDTDGAAQDTPVTLRIIEEVSAGHAPIKCVGEMEATKILTGAPVPDGATAIVKFEKTVFTDDDVTIFADCPAGDNIVPIGEDIKVGDLVVKKSVRLTPALVGLLAGLGYDQVPVYKQVRVSMLSTGDELVEVSESLQPGKIRNSSLYTLQAYLRGWGVDAVRIGTVKDRAAEIAKRMRAGLEDADCLITTGGVSVGDYDMVMEALHMIGAEILFWKVKMKPGMALIAAGYKGKIILGLSGNPSAAAVSLFVLGLPLMKKLSGMSSCYNGEITVRLMEDFPKASPVRRFLPGLLEIIDGQAFISFSRKQGNGMLSPLRNSEVLGVIEAGSPVLQKGSVIKAYRIMMQ